MPYEQILNGFSILRYYSSKSISNLKNMYNIYVLIEVWRWYVKTKSVQRKNKSVNMLYYVYGYVCY